MRYFAVAGLLLFATTAAASEKCVNYVSGVVYISPSLQGDSCESGGCLFRSFNPRSRENVVVAKVDSYPYYPTRWDKDFRAVTYDVTGGTFKLDWTVGAVPTPISPKSLSDQSADSWPGLGKELHPETPPQGCDDSAMPFCRYTADLPANREIQARSATSCDDSFFVAPVRWLNSETGETKILGEGKGAAAEATADGWPTLISTTDNFILVSISSSFKVAETVVADLNTGETVLRDTRSRHAVWGNCPED